MSDSPSKLKQVRDWLRANWWWATFLTLVIILAVGGVLVGEMSPDTFATMRQIAEIAALLIPGTLIVLAVFQIVASNVDRMRYPPPGQLVSVGRRKLHVHCQGELTDGLPTVILDAGLGGTVLDWSLVQPELAQITRVCAYDRAGYGWSESGRGPRTVQQLVDELHALLGNAGIAGPYILVGEGISGLTARLFAAQYRDEVAGLVLVNPAHEDQDDLGGYRNMIQALKQGLNFQEIATWLGWTRLGVLFKRGLAHKRQGADRAFALRAGTYSTAYAELAVLERSMDQMRDARQFLNVPLSVISVRESGNALSDTTMQDLHARLTRLSPQGEHAIIDQNDPENSLALEQPRLVIDVIRDVVERGGQAGYGRRA